MSLAYRLLMFYCNVSDEIAPSCECIVLGICVTEVYVARRKFRTVSGIYCGLEKYLLWREKKFLGSMHVHVHSPVTVSVFTAPEQPKKCGRIFHAKTDEYPGSHVRMPLCRVFVALLAGRCISRVCGEVPAF